MRKLKEGLVFRDDAGRDEMLRKDKHQIAKEPVLVTSYQSLDNPSLHRVISSYNWDTLTVVVTSDSEPHYAELILSRVNKVVVYGTESDLNKYFNTFIKFVPEKAAELRRAQMKGLPLSPILRG